jgi:hypothetical protein
VSDFPQAPSRLGADESQALREWADVHPEENPLLQAGADRNVLRHAEAWGPHLIAYLVSQGLEPAENPLDFLREFVGDL